MPAIKEEGTQSAKRGFSIPIPLFYKITMSMLFVAMIPMILLGLLTMGGTSSIIASIGLDNSVFVITLITGFVVLLLSFFLAGSITRPIVRLANIATAMSTGELKTYEIEFMSNDEIGELQGAFNRMIKTYKILDTLAKEKNE